MVSTHPKICSSDWIKSPRFRVKIKNMWHHHEVHLFPLSTTLFACEKLALLQCKNYVSTHHLEKNPLPKFFACQFPSLEPRLSLSTSSWPHKKQGRHPKKKCGPLSWTPDQHPNRNHTLMILWFRSTWKKMCWQNSISDALYVDMHKKYMYIHICQDYK